MQGDQLLPGHQNIVGRGVRARAPDRRGGDCGGHPVHHRGQVAGGELGLERRGIEGGRMTRTMGGDIDQRRLEPLGVGMAEFERRKLFQVVVQQPGMVERRQ